MAHERATPGPWAWEWSDGTLTIFQPSEKLHCCEVAEVFCYDHKKDDHREQAEHDADLIVTLVNKHFEEEQEKLLAEKIREGMADGQV